MTRSATNNGFQVTEKQLIEKLAQVQIQADNNQIRVIELLLAEVVFMEQHYMSSFHRGQKLDLTSLPHFLEESIELHGETFSVEVEQTLGNPPIFDGVRL